MKLITDVNRNEFGECAGGAEIAIVDLSMEYVTSLIKKYETMVTSFPEDPEWSVEFPDDHAGFFSEVEVKDRLDEEQVRALEDNGWIVVPDFEATEGLEPVSVDTNRVSLTKNYSPEEEARCGVIWSCFPKHEDMRVETSLIVISDILSVVKLRTKSPSK